MNGALKQQVNGNDKWCLTPIADPNGTDPNGTDKWCLTPMAPLEKIEFAVHAFAINKIPVRIVRKINRRAHVIRCAQLEITRVSTRSITI